MTETRQRNCASQGPLRGRPQQSGGKGFHPIKGTKRVSLFALLNVLSPRAPVIICRAEAALRSGQTRRLASHRRSRER